MPRMTIFNSAERKRCFDFPAPLKDIATSLRTSTNQVVFLMSCGYFKATKRFYPVPTFHQRDLAYVSDRIATAEETIDLTEYPRQTMARHQAAILEFYGFRAFKPDGRALLAAEIARLVQSHLKPKLIFSRAVEVLVRDKVEVPGYCPLAALILSAINQHICWNYLYLSQKFAEIEDPVKREEFSKAMPHGSAAAWEHVNLLGEYDLSGGEI